ncbi:DUF1992 domain-containing protein [Cumulibacter soli]|uniref:DnaJ family domain-containing protein n=1 Tax=Cumulibacter soli TaxID=2546344 RepID=UPI001068640E|nr:DUF1992 domain-containing protein [Cumulibacter soli]
MNGREPPSVFYNSCAFEFDSEFLISVMADMQIRRGIERGEFDNLPGSGEPLNLPEQHDPDWWFKSLLKREGLALMPLSILVRKEDAKLDDVLDKLSSKTDVRREIEAFNDLVIRARYYPAEGPPMITQPRDVEETVSSWAGRRAARLAENRRKATEALAQAAAERRPSGRRLFRRRRRVV